MRAISPVIATLLMIAIAVVASLVTYAWVMGYMNFTTEKTGKAIQIQSISYPSTGGQAFTIYVQNVGESDLLLSNANSVFINGAAATGSLEYNILSVSANTASILATVPATSHCCWCAIHNIQSDNHRRNFQPNNSTIHN